MHNIITRGLNIHIKLKLRIQAMLLLLRLIHFARPLKTKTAIGMSTNRQTNLLLQSFPLGKCPRSTVRKLCQPSATWTWLQVLSTNLGVPRTSELQYLPLKTALYSKYHCVLCRRDRKDTNIIPQRLQAVSFWKSVIYSKIRRSIQNRFRALARMANGAKGFCI